ncbi:LysR family transcriptional regulator [Bartonella sp. LJL80]
MKLDPRIIIQFAVVAEELSFTRAAERLHVAQPWLSARIRQLEDQLGFAVFDRNTRNIDLTAKGLEFLKVAQTVAASMASCQALAAQLRRKDDRHVKIGAPPYSHKISQRRDVIKQFSARYPDIGIELDVGWTPTLIDKVRQGELDLSFILGDAPYDDLECQQITQFGISLVMSCMHKLAKSRIIEPEKLAGQKIYVFTRALHPVLFDKYFSPLRQAGAELIQIPEITDDLMDRLLGAEQIVYGHLYFPDTAELNPALIRRRVQLEHEVPFSLIRKKEQSTPTARLFWNLVLGRLTGGDDHISPSPKAFIS